MIHIFQSYDPVEQTMKFYDKFYCRNLGEEEVLRKGKPVKYISANIVSTFNHIQSNIVSTFNHTQANIVSTFNHTHANIVSTFNHTQANIVSTFNHTQHI